MRARPAAEAGLAWSRQYRYLPELVEYFETAREVERRMGADCDGLCVGAIQKAWSLGDAPQAPAWFVIGDTAQGAHAWPQWEIDGERLWGDPTPGWPTGLHPVYWWQRTPRWWYRYDGECFGARGEFARA